MAQGGVRRRWPVTMGAAMLALASCAEPAPKQASAPEAHYEVTIVTPPPPPPPAPARHPDLCGADPLQYLVGKPSTDIPVPVDPGRRRVICASCAVTQEVIQSRLTIVYDADSGLVKSVRCG